MSGYEAYQQRNRSALNAGNVEVEAFLEAAKQLEETARNIDDRRKLVKTIRFVRKLWNILQVDLSSGKSALPDALRADLLSLSLYMDGETLKQNCNPSSEGLQSLCQIHRNIASGLMRR